MYHDETSSKQKRKAPKCKPSAETHLLAREGFHVKAKLRKTALYTQSSVKGCRRGKHATKSGTSFAVHLPCFRLGTGLEHLAHARTDSDRHETRARGSTRMRCTAN